MLISVATRRIFVYTLLFLRLTKKKKKKGKNSIVESKIRKFTAFELKPVHKIS